MGCEPPSAKIEDIGLCKRFPYSAIGDIIIKMNISVLVDSTSMKKEDLIWQIWRRNIQTVRTAQRASW